MIHWLLQLSWLHSRVEPTGSGENLLLSGKQRCPHTFVWTGNGKLFNFVVFYWNGALKLRIKVAWTFFDRGSRWCLYRCRSVKPVCRVLNVSVHLHTVWRSSSLRVHWVDVTLQLGQVFLFFIFLTVEGKRWNPVKDLIHFPKLESCVAFFGREEHSNLS